MMEIGIHLFISIQIQNFVGYDISTNVYEDAFENVNH